MAGEWGEVSPGPVCPDVCRIIAFGVGGVNLGEAGAWGSVVVRGRAGGASRCTAEQFAPKRQPAAIDVDRVKPD